MTEYQYCKNGNKDQGFLLVSSSFILRKNSVKTLIQILKKYCIVLFKYSVNKIVLQNSTTVPYVNKEKNTYVCTYVRWNIGYSKKGSFHLIFIFPSDNFFDTIIGMRYQCRGALNNKLTRL